MPDKILPKTAPIVEDSLLERERLTSLINSMSDGVIATDRRARVVQYNAAALDILDRNTSILDHTLAEILPLLNKDLEPINVSSLIEDSKVPATYRDFRMRYVSDGSIVNLAINISPVLMGYGKTGQGGFVLTIRDITREKSLEEERDEFISVASHELRTPITIAEGNVSNGLFILNRGGSLQQITKALEAAHQQIIFLTDLINDLSTLSRAESGKLPVDLGNINPYDLMNELAENYRGQIESKGLKLQVVLDPKLEVFSSSKLYVREILQNFITNSIKYTSSGSITLKAVSAPGGVKIEVEDTGIGISKSDQSKVFTKFFRSEDYRTRESSGTGLGLYVSEKLANLIKATITLDSKLNNGSNFSLFVPSLKYRNKA